MAFTPPEHPRIEGTVEPFKRPFFREKPSRAGYILLVFRSETLPEKSLLPGDDDDPIEKDKGKEKKKKSTQSGHHPPSCADEPVADIERVADKAIGAPGNKLLRPDLLTPVPAYASGCPEADSLTEGDEKKSRKKGPGLHRTGQKEYREKKGSLKPPPKFKNCRPKISHEGPS